MDRKEELKLINSKNKSLVETHIAVLLFGVAGIFGKLVLLPSIIIVFGRVFFASIFLLCLIFYLKLGIKLQKTKDYFYLSLCGVILAIHWSTFFQSIKVSTVGIGLLTFSTFPVFVTFLEPWFFKEKVEKQDIIIALITLFGVALVIPEFKIGNNMTQGVLWGIASGFTFAILSVLNRKYVKKYPSLIIAFYQDTAATIILLPFLFILKPVFQVNNILLLVVLGIVFTGVSHTLFIDGMKSIKAQTSSIIASLEPVYGIILAIFLLGEIPPLKVILGGAIILSTAFYSTIKSGKTS